MENIVKLKLTDSLNQGYKIHFELKDELIKISYYDKNNHIQGIRYEKPKIIDGTLSTFGEFIEWDKLNTGHIYKIVKNPTSNVSVIIMSVLHDKIIGRELIAISIIKKYERKYF